MEATVKEDIISVLEQAVKIIREQRFSDLKELSNHTIHDASIFQDEDSISIAILIYAMSKTIERCCEKGIPYEKIENLVAKAKDYLRAEREDDYRKTIKSLFEVINTIDDKLKLFVEEVIKRARVKKGSKLYEHGISLSRTADLLGISQWELMSYIGKTQIVEFIPENIPVKERLETARRLFR